MYAFEMSLSLASKSREICDFIPQNAQASLYKGV